MRYIFVFRYSCLNSHGTIMILKIIISAHTENSLNSLKKALTANCHIREFMIYNDAMTA